MVISFFGFVIDWLITRDWRRVALAIVPAALLASVLVLSLMGITKNKENLANEYLAAGETELQSANRDWEFTLGTTDAPATDSRGQARYAEALFRRALDLQNNNKRTRFVVGAMLGNRGAIRQALAYMNSIAPEIGSGYAPAHAWIANLMLHRQLTEAELPALKHHLDLAVKWEHAPANLLIAATGFAVRAKDNSRAIEILRQSPELEGELFRLAVETKNIPVAEKTAETALPRLLEKIADGTASANDRIDAADIFYYKKELQAARGALEDGLKVEGISKEDVAKLKFTLSELFRKRFADTLEIGTNKWSGNPLLLYEAMKIDPTNPQVAEQVALLARVGGDKPSDDLMNQLKKFLAEGLATPLTHAWLAEAYILRGEYGEAINHLEDVLAGMPDSAGSHNNLAYALFLSEPTKLDKALAHAQEAVRLGPGVADYHDTLGEILLAYNRTAEAISEMERAIELKPGQKIFHEHLAGAYEKQGTKDMAEIHRQLAAKYAAAEAEAPK